MHAQSLEFGDAAAAGQQKPKSIGGILEKQTKQSCDGRFGTGGEATEDEQKKEEKKKKEGAKKERGNRPAKRKRERKKEREGEKEREIVC